MFIDTLILLIIIILYFSYVHWFIQSLELYPYKAVVFLVQVQALYEQVPTK